MEKELQALLKSELLNEDVQESIQEAFVKKLEEAKKAVREEVELSVREEYARRYAEAKAELIDATDKMVTETVSKFITDGAVERKAVLEEKQKLTKAIREARADYKAKLQGHKKMLEQFVLNTVKKEVSELAQDHRDVAIQKVRLQKEINEAKKVYEAKVAKHLKMMNEMVANKLKSELSELSEDHKEIVANKIKLKETKVKVVKELREHREHLNETYQDRLGKLEGFIVEQLTKELSELEQDRQELAEAKVKLFAESKAKLLETQKSFVQRASTIVEKKIEAQLRKEFTEMRDDIMEARRNNFGRKIFEAVASEYMVSFYSESKEISKLTETMKKQAAKLNEAMSKVGEQQKLLENTNRKVRLAEDKATRVVELNRLLTPLDKSKRKVMEGLLETVKTEGLKDAYDKYLPHVMTGNTKPTVTPRPAQSGNGISLLNETRSVQPEKKTFIEVTGNKINNKLAESIREEAQTETAEIVNLRRLAGLSD